MVTPCKPFRTYRASALCWLLPPLLLLAGGGCAKKKDSPQAASSRPSGAMASPDARAAARPRDRRASRSAPVRIAKVTRPALTVQVAPTGYRLQGKLQGPEALLGHLRGLSKAQRDRGVMVEILPGAPKSRVVALFDLLQQAGIRRFAARRLASPPRAGAEAMQ